MRNARRSNVRWLVSGLVAPALYVALVGFNEPVYTQASLTGTSRMWAPPISGPAPGEVQILPVQGNVYMLAGAGANITVFNNVWAGNFKQIQLEIRGPDARVLAGLADTVAAMVRSVPGAVDVGLSTKGQKPELDVQLNRGVAGSLGITVGQVAQALRPSYVLTASPSKVRTSCIR